VTIEEVDLEKEIESSGEEEDLKLKKRKSTKQDPFKFGRSKRDKSLHPVYLIFDRLKLTPISKIKDPLPKKSLMKFISQLYQDKFTAPDSTQAFVEFVYDSINFKFGLKNVSEKKFSQIVQSVKTYDQILWVKMFGQFLGLYEPLSVSDLKLYIRINDYLQTIGFKIEN